MQYLKFYGGNMEDNEIIELIPDETSTSEIIETENIQVDSQEEIIQDTNEDINDLLIEYIKNQIENDNKEETEYIKETDEENINITTEIDENYDNQIGETLEEVRSIKSNTDYQSMILDDYNDNNSLSSDMTEISLTNMLLIMIYMSILFSALLNFSRRIF